MSVVDSLAQRRPEAAECTVLQFVRKQTETQSWTVYSSECDAVRDGGPALGGEGLPGFKQPIYVLEYDDVMVSGGAGTNNTLWKRHQKIHKCLPGSLIVRVDDNFG